MNDLIPPPPATPKTEIATVAAMLAAQAEASIKARFAVALARPRNWDNVRIRLIEECKRPDFARNKSAIYRKPLGGANIEGLGIRFVEVALRCMSNVYVDTLILHDDERVRMLLVSMTELEGNETYTRPVTVQKTVERKKPNSDGTFISVRKNTYGEDVYTVEATDDEVNTKEAALVSKAIRTLGLRIIPGGLQDECTAIIKKVRLDDAARDPAAERKSIADAFAMLGILPSDLSLYLGHDFGQCQPMELVALRGLFGALQDGETTWHEIVEAKIAEKPEEEAEWPKRGPNNTWVDSASIIFNAAVHAWDRDTGRPSVTTNGTFRNRRKAKDAPASAPPEKADNFFEAK